IADALALIGLRRTQATDFSGKLADELPISTGDRNRCRALADDLQALGNRIVDVMTVPERQIEAVALDRCPIANTGNLQIPTESLGHTLYHILDPRACRPPHCPGSLSIIGGGYDNPIVLVL